MERICEIAPVSEDSLVEEITPTFAATQAAIDTTSQTRKRKSHTKVRTGCFTCKIRKVKCDESRPAPCKRCLTYGVKCDGYPVINSKKPEARRIVPAKGLFPEPEADSLLFASRYSEEDKRSFDFFRSETAPMLSCDFDEGFWDRFLLRVSHSDPTVWHSVLALSTLHEQSILEHNRPIQGDRKRYALQHYNHAVTRLTGQMADQRKASVQSLDTVLVSCIIFICLETFLGNTEGAIQHLQSGLEIIRSWKTGEIAFKDTGLNCDLKEIESSVVPILEHLNQVTFLYGRVAPPLVYAKFDNEAEMVHFENPQEAGSSLRRLLSESQELAVACTIPNENVLALMKQKQDLLAKLRKWSSMLNKLKLQPENLAGRQPSLAILQIQQKIGLIWVSKALNNSEIAFDSYYKEYADLVDIAEVAITEYEETKDSKDRTDYSFKTQYITPLYVVAIKCRNPKLRRRALELVKRAPQRKGFWSTDVVVRIAERIIELEERGIEDLTDETGELVPSESSRFHFVSVNPPATTDGSRKIILTCTRMLEEPPGGWKIIQEDLTI